MSELLNGASEEDEQKKAPNLDSVINRIGGFGRYQLQLLVTTELSYLICTGSLLSAKYLTLPPQGLCLDGLNGTDYELLGAGISSSDFDDLKSNLSSDLCGCASRALVREQDFYSLFMHLGIYCDIPRWQLLLNMAAMVGGVFGAISFGFLGDRIGRKRMCIMSMTVLILTDFVAAGTFQLWYIVLAMIVIGVACGGVMTGNLAFLMECVGPEYRLLCASLNGWPLGMMVMALTGYVTGHWRTYLLATACLGIPFWFLLFMAHESPRWLVQHNRIREAVSVFDNIASRNQKPTVASLEVDLRRYRAFPDSPDRRYNYFDLTRDRAVFKNLLALFYSWFASAVISFGIYFTMGSLSGNLFLNFFLLGLFKGSTGIIPYLASNPPFRIGRKPIICVFVIVCCVSIWLSIVLYYAHGSVVVGSYLTVLTLLGGAAIDPIWKVNHLYSAELFPTVVRSMARGICNVGSRVGSAFSPLMLFLNQIYFISPYWIYGIMSLGHVFVTFAFLPETKGLPLPEELNDRRDQEQRTDTEMTEPTVYFVANAVARDDVDCLTVQI